VSGNGECGVGVPFDPACCRSGERITDGIFRMDDDVFVGGTADGALFWNGRPR